MFGSESRDMIYQTKIMADNTKGVSRIREINFEIGKGKSEKWKETVI